MTNRKDSERRMIEEDDLRLRLHLKSFIRRRREEIGMSQADLARATGDSDVQISRAERGLHTISAAFAIRLAKALGCSTDEVLGVPLEELKEKTTDDRGLRILCELNPSKSKDFFVRLITDADGWANGGARMSTLSLVQNGSFIEFHSTALNERNTVLTTLVDRDQLLRLQAAIDQVTVVMEPPFHGESDC